MKDFFELRESLQEATDFRKGDTVHQVGSKLKGTVMHKGNRDEVVVKFGTITKTIPSSQLRLVESVELDETKGSGVKKFVRGMRVQNLNGSGKGTVIKGGDNLKKAVEVEWDNGQTTLASAKYLKSIKKNESVELGEAKISVGDRVTLQPNKNTLDRSLIGKAGVVTGMLGSKPTVKFANGKTIAVSSNDLKINESVELGEAMGPLSPQQIAKLKKEYGSIDKINVTGPAYKKVKAMIKKMDKEDLMTLAKAKVKWLSDFAANELRLTHNVKMKAGEYMESVTFHDLRGSLVEARKDAAADLYFNTYSAAIQKAINDTFKKHKLEVDAEDYYQKVNMGPGKPGRGKTTRHTIDLVDVKTGKPSRKKLHIQIYNRETDKNPYELNFYVS